MFSQKFIKRDVTLKYSKDFSPEISGVRALVLNETGGRRKQVFSDISGAEKTLNWSHSLH